MAGVMPASADEAQFLNFLAVGPGGGEVDAYGECDTIATACAATAGVALDACVSAHLDASAAGVAVVAIFPAFGKASATATVSVCQSISNVDMLPGSNFIPATMISNGIAGFPVNTCQNGSSPPCVQTGWNVVATHRSNTCVTAGLGHVACGTGAIYQLDWQDCVGADGLAAVNDGQGYTRLPPPPVDLQTSIQVSNSMPKEGEASARAYVLSASCPSIVHQASTVPPPGIDIVQPFDTSAQAGPATENTVAIDHFPPGIQKRMREGLAATLTGLAREKFAATIAKAPESQRESLSLLAQIAVSKIETAANGFQGLAQVEFPDEA